MAEARKIFLRAARGCQRLSGFEEGPEGRPGGHGDLEPARQSPSQLFYLSLVLLAFLLEVTKGVCAKGANAGGGQSPLSHSEH